VADLVKPNVLKGAACIAASAFGFAVMALAVRLCDDFGAPVSSFQKAFFRNIVALCMALAVFVRRRGASGAVRVAFPPSLWLRATLGTVGIFANFYALSHIPIAEGQTLNKTAPFFTVLFAWLFLGERASARQWTAIAAAFAGATLVIKPAFAGAAAFPLAMGLLGGIGAGGAYACLRRLAVIGIDGAFVVLFFSAFSCVAALPFMAAGLDPMNWRQVLVLVGAGAGAALGQFGITAAYRFAPPREIAVFDYLNIPFTVVLGIVFLGQVPDLLSAVGMAVILLAAVRLRFP